jgi:hypothetical protein
MTSYWGPLGWATLHSASLLYSDEPSPAEREVIRRFVVLFGDTITCYTCRTHFQDMLAKYRNWNPGFLDTKREFVLFVMRAHNTVNKRIDKPILTTFQDCLNSLKNMESYSGFKSLRSTYLDYLQRNWAKEITADGFVARRGANEMRKINEMFDSREIDWDIDYSDDVLFFIDFSKSEFTPRHRLGGGFKNGRLRF